MLIDAFNNGSYVKVIPDECKIVGYTTKNSGAVPANFKNYFVIIFDEPFISCSIFNDNTNLEKSTELKDNHFGALARFNTLNGKQINAKKEIYIYPGSQ